MIAATYVRDIDRSDSVTCNQGVKILPTMSLAPKSYGAKN